MAGNTIKVNLLLLQKDISTLEDIMNWNNKIKMGEDIKCKSENIAMVLLYKGAVYMLAYIISLTLNFKLFRGCIGFDSIDL